MSDMDRSSANIDQTVANAAGKGGIDRTAQWCRLVHVQGIHHLQGEMQEDAGREQWQGGER